jgi:hypothetical protein
MVRYTRLTVVRILQDLLVDMVIRIGCKVCQEYRESTRVASVSGVSRSGMLEVLASGESRFDMLSLPESVVSVKMERTWEILGGLPLVWQTLRI